MTSGEASPNPVQLDVRGEICPYPLVEAKKALANLASGDVLEVLIDYPLALDNVSRWASNAGHQVIQTRDLGPSEWALVLKHA
jgi:TusA-related sulfurtransferase